MKSKMIHLKDMITQSRVYFAIFKMPVILFTAIFGFILEFIIELPFMVLCLLDRGRPQGPGGAGRKPKTPEVHKVGS